MKIEFRIMLVLIVAISTTYTSFCLMEWHYLTVLLTAPLSVLAILNVVGEK